ncbi:superoxide dismutase family protein [Leisingera sp. ANG-Vp]|uniref:superoxide dismutase family protein n=1 Tax=Leisingera sp. ANG-Vp TaxID=1577896 RepID=UPI00057FEF42|nr:superoxide dismutase family protein [Leisingera sp. ANG-Vp]KIC17815.1 superoxide dismutase [Leisingera sp. ANG-Vp]
MLKTFITAAVLSAAASAAALAGGHINSAKADLINADGEIIGAAHLTQGPNGVLLHLKVSGLTPGKHGLHLHSHGTCDPGTGFKSAKGHVGKVEGAHGLMNPEGPEPGDLPNLFVAADGTGEMEAFTSLVTLDGGDHALLDADGSTFIIHENGDDHISQPIGGAGARVACGIVTAG